MDMKINVEVGELDLDTELGGHYDEDGDWVRTTTLADLIVSKLVDRQAASKEYGQSIAERVRTIRDEEIRAQIAPAIAEALAMPITLTNSYGEKTGKETTLRELVIKTAREVINEPADKYNRDRGTALSVALRKEVTAALQGELAQAVADIKAQLVKTLTGDVSSMIAKAAADAVKK